MRKVLTLLRYISLLTVDPGISEEASRFGKSTLSGSLLAGGQLVPLEAVECRPALAPHLQIANIMHVTRKCRNAGK